MSAKSNEFPERVMRKFFVFDVESIGLHGEGFAVAGGAWQDDGNPVAGTEFCFACPTMAANGSREDREWCYHNLPFIKATHETPADVRAAFWEVWVKAKRAGAEMAAECLWPVEARFLEDCLDDFRVRAQDGPYPVHEIASIMLAAGMDPLATYLRLSGEGPQHHPLCDSRQSARLLCQALAMVNVRAVRPRNGEPSDKQKKRCAEYRYQSAHGPRIMLDDEYPNGSLGDEIQVSGGIFLSTHADGTKRVDQFLGRPHFRTWRQQEEALKPS